MRKDVCHYYDRDLKSVFDAYFYAATQRFGKNCTVEPFHTISFGLNMSFKYNMNGGACNVHFMPYGSGTAVDVRYTVVQLAGARIGAYDKVMTDYVVGILRVPAGKIDVSPETFLLPENMVTTLPQPVQPAQPAQPTPQPQPRPVQHVPVQPVQPVQPRTVSFCTKCGTRAEPGDLFCAACGSRLK